MSGNIKFRWFLLASIFLSFPTSCATASQLSNAQLKIDKNNTTKPWANFNGFRSANFGMEMREVKDAIHQDFGMPDRKITTITHPTEQTQSLGITVEQLLPNSGKARIVYVFGYRTQRLIQVNILMGHPIDASLTPQQVVDAGNILGNDFFKKRYQEDGLVAHAKLDDGSILIFRGKDQKGRMALLRLSNPQPNNRNNDDLKIALSLSYIENPGQPDAYQLGGFADVQTPRPSQPSSPALPPVAKAPPQSQQPPKAVESVYSGTGFLFSAKDYVITNWHVVRGTNNIKVKFLNGEEIKAEVALKDPQNDIAFLKLERQPKLPPSDLKIGDSSKMRMGDKVFTIGYPAHRLMGDNPKYTEGVVNAISGLQDDPTVFQISVQIQPGNSGGPLFNSSGEVIGITQASLDPKVAIGTFGTLPQNVNYAIKSSYISALLPMLPQTLIASRGIMVIPTEPENNLANFIEKAKKNIVLIEATE